MLDVGADIRADEKDLLQYALMGGSYARNGLGIERPRIGLLNVGTEEHKGRSEIKNAYDLITEAAPLAELDFVGFVEGGDIPSRRVDVIVTDGFTGNVALKTGEGTARLIREFLSEAFRATPLSRVAALIALTSLKRLSMRIDPRRVNGGGVFGVERPRSLSRTGRLMPLGFLRPSSLLSVWQKGGSPSVWPPGLRPHRWPGRMKVDQNKKTSRPDDNTRHSARCRALPARPRGPKQLV